MRLPGASLSVGRPRGRVCRARRSVSPTAAGGGERRDTAGACRERKKLNKAGAAAAPYLLGWVGFVVKLS